MLSSCSSSSAPSTDVSRYLDKTEEIRRDCSSEFVDVDKCMEEAIFGDLIEIKRKLYSHFVVYVATDTVVHFTTGGDGSGRVLDDKLTKVTNGDNCRVNNLDQSAQTLNLEREAPNIIVAKAYDLFGRYKYDVEKFNCEHFATQCAYGTAFSVQAVIIKEAPFVRLVARLGSARVLQSS